MNYKIYQVDAFTKELFKGNPAAVCPLKEWLPDKLMQQIAAENNLSETAFIVPERQQYRIRWFTPALEVDLCGHATLAAAHIYFSELQIKQDKIVFESKSGPLLVKKANDGYIMDFPRDPIQSIPLPEIVKKALRKEPIASFKGKSDYLFILNNQEEVLDTEPDFALLKTLPARGIIISAVGKDVDFVSRFFAPQCGINEDPVTGSAHTTLVPYWAERLQKQQLTAKQVSERGGYLSCFLKKERVEIKGNAKTYLKGEIIL